MCSKKKGLQKIFSGDGVKNFFSAGLQNFNRSKNSAVLEPRTGLFLKTRGFEGKDLTFDTKAKNVKMCPRSSPRGQGRPRGLHLCHKAIAHLCNQFIHVLQ